MKKTTDRIEEWRKDLPKVKALAPYGHARANARFKLVPTHPDSQRLTEEFCAWSERIGIFPGETAEIPRRSQMGHLVYWHAPLSSDQARWLIGTFHLWVTAVDDLFVERGLPLDELADACDAALRLGQSGASPSPYVQFFIEHREQVLAARSEGLLAQIADQVQRYFRDWKQEQVHLQERTLPPLVEYLRLRVGITALYGQIHSQRVDKHLWPHELPFESRLDKLGQLVNVMVSLSGDVIGIEKDINNECPINVIPVIALDFGVDLPTAYLMAVELLDLYKSIFDALVLDVCAMPGPFPAAAAQATTLALWLDGFHTWHTRASRFAGERASDVADIALPRSGEYVTLLGAITRSEDAAKTTNAHLGAGNLGTSALRLAETLRGTEILKQWALGLLGWSTPADVPALPIETSAKFVEIKPTGLGSAAVHPRDGFGAPSEAPKAPLLEFKPTGMGNAAANVAALTTSAAIDAPAVASTLPSLTGLGTSAAKIVALLPTSPT